MGTAAVAIGIPIPLLLLILAGAGLLLLLLPAGLLVVVVVAVSVGLRHLYFVKHWLAFSLGADPSPSSLTNICSTNSEVSIRLSAGCSSSERRVTRERALKPPGRRSSRMLGSLGSLRRQAQWACYKI